jgi:hypothetical protein
MLFVKIHFRLYCLLTAFPRLNRVGVHDSYFLVKGEWK